MGILTLTNGSFPRLFQSELKFQFPGRRKLSDKHPESLLKSNPWPQSLLHTHLEKDDYYGNDLHGNGRIKKVNVEEKV